MIKRIMIFGCCGCGKTTLSKKIQNITNLPLIHLDSINWQDNWRALPTSEFDSIVKKEVKKTEWIIEGLYIHNLETRIQYADTIIYLDSPRWLCIYVNAP